MNTTPTLRLLPTAAALLCAFSHLAIAVPDEMETLTITGSRLDLSRENLAASTSVITEDEIRRSGALQITDLLRALPGVTIAQSGAPGSLTEIRVRGSESNHLLVLIDGVVANDTGQGSLVDLAHLTAGSIKKIELLRGPQSALWGSGAIGGVLSITTKASAEPNTSASSVKVGIGSRDTTTVNLSASGQQDNVQFATYADWFETAGDNIARAGTEDDGYRNITTGGSLAWQASDTHKLSTTLRYVDYASDYDGTDPTTGLPADAFNVTDGEQISGQINWLVTPQATAYSSNLSLQYRKDKNDNTTGGTPAGSTQGSRVQMTWLNRYEIENWQMAGGVEWLRREFSQRGAVDFGNPNQDQHDTTFSGFGELVGALTKTITANVSARYDENSEYDDAISYRAGLTWDATKMWSLFASLGKAIKNPTFVERFGYYPQSFIGNPELEPEKSTEWEVGARAQFTSRLSGEVSYFNADLENEIIGYVFDSDLGAATAQNATADSDRKGIDASLNWQGEWANLRASYSYLDASENNQPELRRAKHTGALTLSGDLPVDNLSGYVKLAYTGERFDTYYPPYPASAETLELGGYTLVSVNFTYDISSQWQAGLRLDNAFDKTYEDIVGYAGEKRRALATITYQF